MKTLISTLHICLAFILINQAILANEPVQNIRGTITDTDSQMPIIGANIIITGITEFIGTSSDVDGSFRLEGVPVGRVNVQVTAIGYEPRTIPNILVGSGKEVILKVEMKESVTEISEIVISAKKDKTQLNNDMALLSSRAFTIEETKRYAGSFNDPARMVSSYAGVTADPHGNNSIVVRGNASKGIQWRLDGIEIPNPNHFADEGMTGGPISALNSELLSNSDFHTGAFAPEYGNAYSGIFDMQMRTGNNEEREYSFGIGVLGTDISMEGPISKGARASYLFNYRYSSLQLLDQAGVVDFDGVPKFSDMTFKLHVPTQNIGTFNLFGLGGRSSIEETTESDDGTMTMEKGKYQSGMGVVGMNHNYIINEKMYLKSSAAISQNFSNWRGKEIDSTFSRLIEGYHDDLVKYTYQAGTNLNVKFNAKNRLRTGVNYQIHNYEFTAIDPIEDYIYVDKSDKGAIINSYMSWKYRANEKLTFVTGLHSLHFNLNNETTFEPRVGMRWQVNPKQSFNAGFGVHSRIEPLIMYFENIELEDGTTHMANKNLRLPKANHYVLGYNYLINKNLNAKIEVYYQQLYDIGVGTEDSTFSMLNLEWGSPEQKLVSKGTGRNYGMEFTLERFYANNFFYLITASVYDSKYKTLDGKLRNTTFNGNYAANVLFGKEFQLGEKEKSRVLGISSKFTIVGGRRTTPLNLAESLAQDKSVYEKGDNVYSRKSDDIFQLNLAVYIRRDFKKVAHEFKIDIQNVTNNKTKLYPYYSSFANNGAGGLKYSEQLSIMPNVMYRINF